MLSITVKNLHKEFPGGAQAVQDVSFAVAAGEGVVLLGPNGSGKSTLLRCITGLERATSGSIQVGEVDTTVASERDLRAVRANVGMVFQRFNLIGSLSVFHNVLQGALGRSRGPWCWWPATAPGYERDRAMECLERVGLDQLASRRARTLSGGQQQRVALARMLMQDPQLILADEPVASLDPKAGIDVMDLLWEIVRERQLTLVCTLHQVDLALQYSERLLGLQNGRLILDGPTSAVTSDQLRDLYGQKPLRQADVEEVAVSTVSRKVVHA